MKRTTTAFAMLVAFCMAITSSAQQIQGKVLNETGMAAAHVTVNFLNKANRVVTNADGSFKIMATKLPDTLIFSALGYEPYKVVVTQKTVSDPNFEIVLLAARQEMAEVVVTGYATKKRKSVTGSVARPLEDGFVSTSTYADVALEGKVAGLSVDEAARPAAVKVRGAGSTYRKAATLNTDTYLGKKMLFTDSVATDKDGKAYATKLLTAGEINDFAKWKMWEDFTETDFKTHANYWNLYPKQRYCVQLQNHNNKAVTGMQVYLIDRNTHDTVWRAVTDNTGKAELWAGLNQPVKTESSFMLYCKDAESITEPTVFENGINKMTLDAPCNASKAVDIAFVVDATGSMGDEIEYLKVELEDVLNKTFSSYTNLDVHAAAVFYRDAGDQYITKHVDFNSDLLKVLNFIKLQSAGGGGDFPEAVHSALHTAIDSLHWHEDARAKIIFLVLDAPPHNEVKTEMLYLIQQASARGIRIVPVVCSGADKSTEFMMRSIALATNGTYVFLTDHSGVGGSHVKPTTDVFNVELLNNLLPRLIQQMLYVDDCTNEQKQTVPITRMPRNVLKVQVSPNPTHGAVHIKSSKELKEVFVADFTGKILMRVAATDKQTSWKLDIGAYPSGTYIIRYITAENEWGAEKLVLMH